MLQPEEIDEQCLKNYKYIFQKDILTDKVAFITGGGSGICFTIAEIFMRHGCDTVIVSRKLSRLQKSAATLSNSTGRHCLPIQMDVRQPQSILSAVDAALKKFGKIDYLINGAAGNFLCALDRMSFNAFKTVMDIDALGTFNVSKVVFDKVFKEHGGVIINITATLHVRGTVLQAHAGSAKAAIEAMTRHMAVEWGQHGVRVMCVAPGPIADTEGFRRLGKSLASDAARESYLHNIPAQNLGKREDIASGRGLSEQARFIEENIPVQRIGGRVDIANICLFTVSEAGELLTGTTIVADGGSWLTNDNSLARMKLLKSVL